MYDKARPFYELAVESDEMTLGPEHSDLAVKLNNLAALLMSQVVFGALVPANNRSQGKYDQAKPLFERAIEVDERTLRPEYPTFATQLYNLRSC